MLTSHGVTHTGRVRKTNEDTLLVDAGLGVWVVADGMGGHKAGDVASRLAVDTIRSFLARSAGGDEFTWPYGIEPTLSFAGNRLMTSIKLANRRVVKAGESRDDYAGLGTTVVAAMIDDGQITYTGVGDSRIYALANGRLVQLTEDDSWAATLLRSGEGPAPASHPMRNVLTNVVGAREPLEMTVAERALEPNETFLLCSDGLHGALDDDTIAAYLSSPDSPEQVAGALVELALARDGRDNITAVVIRWEQDASS